jgi:hypothetical protein
MRRIEQLTTTATPLPLKSGWLLGLAVVLAACTAQHHRGMNPDTGLPTILVINHGQTSARVFYSDRSYLGRVGADEQRCFTLRRTLPLVVERFDGTWRLPDFSPLSAPGWRIELANRPIQVHQEMLRTLLPAEPCKRGRIRESQT